MNAEKIAVPGCRGTTVQRLLLEDRLQVLKVEVEPGGEIPLHSHDCAATMVITQGRARTLGENGRIVRKGETLVKAANEPHGFADVREPFEFISISNDGGIMRGDRWDMDYV